MDVVIPHSFIVLEKTRWNFVDWNLLLVGKMWNWPLCLEPFPKTPRKQAAHNICFRYVLRHNRNEHTVPSTMWVISNHVGGLGSWNLQRTLLVFFQEPAQIKPCAVRHVASIAICPTEPSTSDDEEGNPPRYTLNGKVMSPLTLYIFNKHLKVPGGGRLGKVL